MAVNLVGGVAAYAEAAKRGVGQSGGETLGLSGGKEGPGFADLVKDVVSQAIGSGQAAEQVSMAAAGDKANVTDVVTAVANAELSLQTIVTVRDKMVQAYEEIMKMPI